MEKSADPIAREISEHVVKRIVRWRERGPDYPRGMPFVLDEDARCVMGDELFDIMKGDPIRRLGPEPGTTYPWNVVDYLAGQALRK